VLTQIVHFEETQKDIDGVHMCEQAYELSLKVVAREERKDGVQFTLVDDYLDMAYSADEGIGFLNMLNRTAHLPLLSKRDKTEVQESGREEAKVSLPLSYAVNITVL
jgi:hypothetical protein